MLFTMFIDLDHLLARPVFDECRCSVGFHPLHSSWAGVLYMLLLLHRRTRIVGIGLCLHLVTDAIDCALQRLDCGAVH